MERTVSKATTNVRSRGKLGFPGLMPVEGLPGGLPGSEGTTLARANMEKRKMEKKRDVSICFVARGGMVIGVTIRE